MNNSLVHAIKVPGVFCLAAALSACQPDYTKAGDDGGAELKTTTRGVTYDAGRVAVQQPQCGQTYFLSSTARQQLFVCDNFDFTHLYENARASAAYQATNVQCPAECPGPHTWENFRRWECADVFNPIIAFAAVEMGVLCPKPKDARPADLDRPTAEQLAVNGRTDGGPPNSMPAIVEEIGANAQISCNTREGALFEYSEPVPACDQVGNYQPFVQRAEDMARRYHGSLSCMKGCNRDPYRTVRKQWHCENTAVATIKTPARYAVMVEISFEVNCH